MPSYAPDHSLLNGIATYVQEVHGGVVKRAASALHLDYIMLRRFLRGGRAKPENRQRIRNALEAVGWEVTREHKIVHGISVEVTRSMLTQLLEALDVYQHTVGFTGRPKP